jgi:predicted Zn-dependent protease
MTEPLGSDGLARLAEPALALAGGRDVDGVEVLVRRSAGGLARFANSQLLQHVDTEDVEVGVRVVAPGGRVGVVGVSTDDPAEVARTAAEAAAIARLAPGDPDFPGLAPRAPVAGVEVDEATAAASPADRAAAVAALLAEVPGDVDAAGAYETGATELGVFTSAGQAATARVSRAALTTVLSGATSSGYAEAGGRSAAVIDPGALGRRALAKVRAAASPVDVDPGTWPVVLEPAATGALVQFLALLGFSGRAYLEGRAFTSGRLGEAALDPKVTVVDDALSPDTVGFPFDAEGTPKQRVELVRGGVLGAVVHDRATGARAGSGSTGHGLPAPNTYGPVAANPLMAAGDDGSVDDLVAGCERGLAVTRFHYTNVVQPLETVLTGMTRDGTFLVEDGRVVGAVRNLRFTQSILEALARVDAVSTETGYASELFFGGSRCPGLRLPAFTFTSTTTFG